MKKKTIRQKLKDKSLREEQAQGAGAEFEENANGSEETQGQAKAVNSGRVQKKVVKQMRFLGKLQRTQKALAATKVLRKKRKSSSSLPPGLALATLAETLGEALPDFSADMPGKKFADRPQTKVLRSKARQKLVQDETRQMGAVLQHPLFHADPLRAIHEHLKNVMPKESQSHSTDALKKRGNVNGSKKRNQRKERGKGGGMEGMDVS